MINSDKIIIHVLYHIPCLHQISKATGKVAHDNNVSAYAAFKSK
jgi:hypothetical protein